MRVDVIMTNYNKAPYIREALLSILNQKTDKIAQIYVCDDCSTDNSIHEVRTLQMEYPGRITIIQQIRNIGGCQNTAFAYHQGTSDLVASLDADDTWDNENKIELMVQAMVDNPEIIVCTSQWSSTDMQGNRFTPDISAFYPNKFHKINAKDLLSTPEVVGTISFSTDLIMIRREIVPRIFTDDVNSVFFGTYLPDSFRYQFYLFAENERNIGLFTESMATLRANQTSMGVNNPQLISRTRELLMHCNYRQIYAGNAILNQFFDTGIEWLKPRFLEELEKAKQNNDTKIIERSYQAIIQANNREMFSLLNLNELFGEKTYLTELREFKHLGLIKYLRRVLNIAFLTILKLLKNLNNFFLSMVSAIIDFLTKLLLKTGVKILTNLSILKLLKNLHNFFLSMVSAIIDFLTKLLLKTGVKILTKIAKLFATALFHFRLFVKNKWTQYKNSRTR